MDRPIRWLLDRLTGVAIMLAILTVGCGIFDTRDPDPPGSEPQVPFDNPTSPRVVLKNVELTLEAKATTNYDSSLREDFNVTPDPRDAADFDPKWSKTREVDAHDSILATEATLEVIWTIPQEGTLPAADQGPNGERQEYYSDLGYELVFTLETETKRYTGTCDMYFREHTAGLWGIYDWIDKSDGSGNDTWGRLRIDRGAGLDF